MSNISLLRFFGITSVPIQERINFARHLSISIKSGLTLLDALDLIRRQTSSRALTRIIESIIKDVNNGQSLTDSLEPFRYVFGQLFISMIKVGEAGGTLSQALLYLSEELKKQRGVRHRVRSALIYPTIILFATLGITIFLTLFIFPKILPIFQSLGVQLPFTTRLIIQMLTFLNKFGLLMVGGIIIFVIAVRLLLLVKKVRNYFDRFLLLLPFVSTIIVDVTLTNFTRSLSVLLKSGMTLIDALGIAKTTFGNLYYRSHIDGVIEVVKRGEEMTKYLEKRPKLFPPMLIGMIRVGEGTGNLEENLLYLSEYYEGEVDELVKNLTTILEPMLMLLMGLIVGFVALAIVTPIYKVTQGLRI